MRRETYLPNKEFIFDGEILDMEIITKSADNTERVRQVKEDGTVCLYGDEVEVRIVEDFWDEYLDDPRESDKV